MDLHTRRSATFLGILLASTAGLSAPAVAQGFNIDFDDFGSGLPPTSATYAAAGTAGVWNQVMSGFTPPVNLVDKSGSATGVLMTRSAGMTLGHFYSNVNITGQDANLLEDFTFGGAAEFIKFSGLANGNYTIYTYAIAPDGKTAFASDVDVAQSSDGRQVVGGALWSGAHEQGVSYALHNAVVTTGTLTINISINVSDITLNGIQIEPAGDSGTAYCFGDGTGAICPCLAFGGTGEGCVTTSGGGATLVGTGIANAQFDSLVLRVTGAPAGKPGIFFQGSGMMAIPAGDGILCSSSSLRYGVNVTDASGMVTQTGFGANAAAGQTLNYQYWFRDPSNPCLSGGFNFSNGWFVTWQ